MKSITIQLSEDDVDLLSSALWDYRDEGPLGEGWASVEIEELRAKIDVRHFMTDHLLDHQGNRIIRTGDEVENDDARFFVGAINESQRLCTLDKSKPWTLKNEASPMAACIRQGNYSASAQTLRNLSNDSSAGTGASSPRLNGQ